MSVARTARRRRKQAANGFTHIARRQRPTNKNVRRVAARAASRVGSGIAKKG